MKGVHMKGVHMNFSNEEVQAIKLSLKHGLRSGLFEDPDLVARVIAQLNEQIDSDFKYQHGTSAWYRSINEEFADEVAEHLATGKPIPIISYKNGHAFILTKDRQTRIEHLKIGMSRDDIMHLLRFWLANDTTM